MKELNKISKALIPLTLMTMTGLFAESEIADNCCPQPCCPEPKCCTPLPKKCCEPQPRKCIECECYNPKFYDLQCDWGVFVQADFLYWYAAESNLEYANTVRYFLQTPQQGDPVQLGVPVHHYYLDSKWKPGVRVGIGMNSECDGWDILLNWTYFKNHTSGSRSQPMVDDQTDVLTNGIINGINDPWAYPLLIGVNDPVQFAQWAAPYVSAKWSLNFNQIDLEIGKKYWVSKSFTLRPYTGIRGAWTHTNFRVTADRLDLPVGTTNQTISFYNENHFSNKYWGVGILGGIQPQFVFGSWCGCGVFSLYGNFEGAALWGDYRGRNTFDAAIVTTINDVSTEQEFLNPHEDDKYSRMQGILDLGIGIRWEEHWCCDRYMTTIDLGWEHHYWFDFGLYHRINGGLVQTVNDVPFATPTGSDNFVTNLGLGGFVLRFRLDF